MEYCIIHSCASPGGIGKRIRRLYRVQRGKAKTRVYKVKETREYGGGMFDAELIVSRYVSERFGQICIRFSR